MRGLHEHFIEMVAANARCLRGEWTWSIWAKDHGGKRAFGTVSLSISFVVVSRWSAVWSVLYSCDTREIPGAGISHVVRHRIGELWWTALQPLCVGTKCSGVCCVSD